MNDHPTPTSPPARRRMPVVLGFAIAAAFALGACGGAVIATVPPSVSIPTMPPDDLASGTAACIDEPTMAIIDQLRAGGANVPVILSENKDALIAGLEDLESTDTTTTAWRDELVAALESGNMDLAALQVAKLTNDEVTITPC